LNILARSNLCGAAVGAGDSPLERSNRFTAASVATGWVRLIALIVTPYDNSSAASRKDVYMDILVVKGQPYEDTERNKKGWLSCQHRGDSFLNPTRLRGGTSCAFLYVAGA
jgi:hypothetical protein